jgi:hypothetical protein
MTGSSSVDHSAFVEHRLQAGLIGFDPAFANSLSTRIPAATEFLNEALLDVR